ncbi:hypothetical protein M1523_04200 [Patescibacteria group bacterium]|nr:hypothetical protein [Patescibacteria group bacterium]MCL5091890.1 hypothetical protein [Patescibacteria group bacterium]
MAIEQGSDDLRGYLAQLSSGDLTRFKTYDRIVTAISGLAGHEVKARVAQLNSAFDNPALFAGYRNSDLHKVVFMLNNLGKGEAHVPHAFEDTAGLAEESFGRSAFPADQILQYLYRLGLITSAGYTEDEWRYCMRAPEELGGLSPLSDRITETDRRLLVRRGFFLSGPVAEYGADDLRNFVTGIGPVHIRTLLQLGVTKPGSVPQTAAFEKMISEMRGLDYFHRK